MFAARNHLNAFNVPAKPMADVDSTYEFLEQYVAALVVTMWGEINSAEHTTAEPSEDRMNEILDMLVDTFVFPGIETEDTTDDIIYMPSMQKNIQDCKNPPCTLQQETWKPG